MRTLRLELNGARATITHNPDWSGDAIVRWNAGAPGGPREVAIPGEIFLAVIKASTLGVRESLKLCLEHLGGEP